jgi:heat shock protein HtpX
MEDLPITMSENLYTHQDSNIWKTWFLMAGFFAFVGAIGWIFARAEGEPFIFYAAIALSVIMNLVAYWNSDSIALSMSGARKLERSGNERLFRIVENLSITAGLPMPRLYIIPGEQINAFATGRNPEHAAVAVTQGALAKLNDNELEGVLAHELSHVGNRDILISSVVIVLAGVISIMADMFLRMGSLGRSRDSDSKGNNLFAILALIAALLAPLAATMVRLAISRRREYLADTSGALLTRYPEGLASALEKIAMDSSPLPRANNATAHLYLSNPFREGSGKMNWLAQLFMTHPPLEDRIRILRGMK